MKLHTYQVTAEREDGWWALIIHVDDREVATQAKRLDQIPDVARDAVSIVTGIDEKQIALRVLVRLPGDTAATVSHARELRDRYEVLAREVVPATREAAHVLREKVDLPMRDIATLTGVSTARVSQVFAAGKDKPPAHDRDEPEEFVVFEVTT